MRIIKLYNLQQNTHFFVIVMPSGRKLGGEFPTKREASAFLKRVLKDAKELVSGMAVANA